MIDWLTPCHDSRQYKLHFLRDSFDQVDVNGFFLSSETSIERLLSLLFSWRIKWLSCCCDCGSCLTIEQGSLHPDYGKSEVREVNAKTLFIQNRMCFGDESIWRSSQEKLFVQWTFWSFFLPFVNPVVDKQRSPFQSWSCSSFGNHLFLSLIHRVTYSVLHRVVYVSESPSCRFDLTSEGVKIEALSSKRGSQLHSRKTTTTTKLQKRAMKHPENKENYSSHIQSRPQRRQKRIDNSKWKEVSAPRSPWPKSSLTNLTSRGRKKTHTESFTTLSSEKRLKHPHSWLPDSQSHNFRSSNDSNDTVSRLVVKFLSDTLTSSMEYFWEKREATGKNVKDSTISLFKCSIVWQNIYLSSSSAVALSHVTFLLCSSPRRHFFLGFINETTISLEQEKSQNPLVCCNKDDYESKSIRESSTGDFVWGSILSTLMMITREARLVKKVRLFVREKRDFPERVHEEMMSCRGDFLLRILQSRFEMTCCVIWMNRKGQRREREY